MSDLNPAQREAVEHGDGPLLIAASPGSGKTACATSRVAKLLERGVSAHRILLLTFTNKAANEMRERVVKYVGADAKRVVAGTFHSVCVRLLRGFESDALRDGRKKDFSIYDGDDSEGCVKMAISELELDKKEFKASEFREKISLAKANALTWQDMPEDDDLAIIGKRIWQRYEEILKHNNALDFDDLLNVVMRRAEADDDCGRALRQRFTHVLVDEYQDTSHVQFRLVKALGSSRNISVVGDPNQAIFSFRAADPKNIRDFAKEFPDAKVVHLATNYRSSKNIVSTFNSLVPEGFATTDNPVGDRTLIRSFGDDAAEARFVVAGILNKIANGTPPGEIAVLYRIHALSRSIEEELRRQGQRYQLVGGMGFYERKVVKDSMAYLRLISNPDSDLDFERIINEPARGLGEKAVAKIRERARNAGKSLSAGVEDALASGLITGKAYEGLQRFYYVMKQVREVAEGTSHGRLAAAANHLLTATGYRLSLETKFNRFKKERKAAEAEKVVQDKYNLEQVVAAVDAYEKRVEKATLQGYLEEVSLISAQDDLGGAKITLATGHSTKGLEFDAVWVVGFERGMLPFALAATEAEQEEEGRLAYVMCSRPRKWLTISYCDERFLRGRIETTGPSEFLDRIPVECSIWRERDEKLEALKGKR